MKNDCSKEFDSFKALTALPDDTVTAMAYVPFQTDKSMFDTEIALSKGTLFTDLYKPFLRGALK
ncbi:MAG: spore coat associated protein CotJA [Clostridia bacterium]|nr:spore coat associated protein CotJA [Clostridia bacterium]